MLYRNILNTNPYFNLALEEYLLKDLPVEEDIFLLWQNADTVVIGRYQNTTEEVNTIYAAQQNITIARRITGGGAVYHDLGNVNFSFIRNCENEQALDFSSFSERMADALRDMGVDVQISGRNDMTVDGRKFSGSAQTVVNGRVLHHGTLLFQTNLTRMQHVLNVSQEKLATKGLASIQSRVTNLSEYLGDRVNIDQFKVRLLEYFICPGTARELELTEEQSTAVLQLERGKYSSLAWIYGRSPGYTVRKKMRFPSGQVEVLLETKRQGIISNIAFQGDFFGSGDIRELEQRLTHTALYRDSLYAALEHTDVEQYISGVSTEQLIQLILS